jgi:hypothetical protein
MRAKPIRDQQADRDRDGDRGAGRSALADMRRKAVDHGLKQNRDIDVGDLRHDKASDRRAHPRAQVPADARPQMRQQLPDRLPLAHAFLAALGTRLNCHEFA